MPEFGPKPQSEEFSSPEKKKVEVGVSWLKQNKAARALTLLAVLGMWGAYGKKNMEKYADEPTQPIPDSKYLKGEVDQKFSPAFEAQAFHLKSSEERQGLLEAIREGNVGYKVYARDLFPQDEKGDVYINYSALISPVGVALEKVAPQQESEIMAQVPYEYAREFDLAKQLNAEDSKRLKDFLVQEMQNQLIKDQVAGLDSKDIYFNAEEKGLIAGMNPQEREGMQVDSIQVIGMASPEGPRERGSETIAVNSIDPENVELATRRAEHAKPTIEQALKEVLEGNEQALESLDVVGAEAQFAGVEWDGLESMANRLGYSNPTAEAKIFSMIIDFNDGEIKDPQALESLQEIIGSKRTVILQVEYKNDQKETFAIPVPLLALLAVAPWLRIRRRGSEKGKGLENSQKSALSGSPNQLGLANNLGEINQLKALEQSNLLGQSGEIGHSVSGNLGILEESGLENQGKIEDQPVAVEQKMIDSQSWLSVKGWWEKEGLERSRTIAFTIHQDIEPTWDTGLLTVEAEGSEQKTISYHSLMTEAYLEIDSKQTQTLEQREKAVKNLAEEILYVWEEHDKAKVVAAGIDPLTVEEKFREYFKEEEQIKWARVHAEALIAAAESKKEYGQKRTQDSSLSEKEDIDFLVDASKKLTNKQ